MRIAMVGTRGVPARYGGFETAIEEVGRRLVDNGHEVLVYCRGQDKSSTHLGMRRITLPAIKRRTSETLSHSALSVLHMVRANVDVAFVFNAANAPLLPIVRASRIPVAVHVDGLEWQRGKWGRRGRQYYLQCERLAVRWADALIADAIGIQDYYRTNYESESDYIPYGAPICYPGHSSLQQLDLEKDGFHLVVARLEPENNVDKIISAYAGSSARLPLVVVGSVPYPNEYQRTIADAASNDNRIRLLGSVWDQSTLDQLYAGCRTYIHGHSVGGTNPSLLRAMGAGANVLAWDVVFNREVLGESGAFFCGDDDFHAAIEKSENCQEYVDTNRLFARHRAQQEYQWERVGQQYEDLALRLTAGRSRRGRKAD